MQSATLVEFVPQDQKDPLANEASDHSTINRALKAIRAHLRMDVAYVSRFEGDQAIFRAVDAPGLEEMIKVGDTHAFKDIYCPHILESRLPELMPDTSEIPLAASMPITNAVPIGRHLSIPLKLSSGEIYGMICCFGFEPDKSLNERDVNLMRMFAEFTVQEIERELTAGKIKAAKREIINNVIREGRVQAEYQPIYSLVGNQLGGFQCHAVFQSDQPRKPDFWFKDAEEVGVGDRLQIEVAKIATNPLARFRSGLFLIVTASIRAIASGQLCDLFTPCPANRIFVEITQPSPFKQDDRFIEEISALKEHGVGLAIDTQGMCATALQQMFRLEPEIIKIDIELARALHEKPVPDAINPALKAHVQEKGCKIIFNGNATPDDIEILTELYGSLEQSYHCGRKMGLTEALQL